MFRLDVTATAKLLVFTKSHMQILLAVGKLTPLGDPAPNAPKWFAAVEMIRLATDQDWLHKATKEIAKYWRHKRERRQNPVPLSRQAIKFRVEKVTPNSSPKVTPYGQFEGNNRAMRSDEKAIEKFA
jgi:hypothetical protein